MAAVFGALQLLLITSTHAGIVPSLPSLGTIDTTRISISGLSSGADMAAQFIVAYSKTIIGAGVFAGNPWNCAVTRFPLDTLLPATPGSDPCDGCPPNTTVGQNHCKNSNKTFALELVDVGLLKTLAEQRVKEGAIDDLSNLARAKVYTYAGTKDGSLGATMATHKFFEQFLPAENLLANFSIPSGHCWPQDRGINNCGLWPQNPWSGTGNAWPLENCGYDGPGALLNHVYGQFGKLAPPAEHKVDSNLHFFNQSPFNNYVNGTDSKSRRSVGLGELGLIYIPTRCSATTATTTISSSSSSSSSSGGGSNTTTKPCSLHVVFHGCENPFVMEYPEMNEISYNRWAETNDIVVLYPHVVKHGPSDVASEQGACWDSYGSTGRDYDTKQGIQMMAIQAMIETLSGVQM